SVVCPAELNRGRSDIHAANTVRFEKLRYDRSRPASPAAYVEDAPPHQIARPNDLQHQAHRVLVEKALGEGYHAVRRTAGGIGISKIKKKRTGSDLGGVQPAADVVIKTPAFKLVWPQRMGAFRHSHCGV